METIIYAPSICLIEQDNSVLNLHMANGKCIKLRGENSVIARHVKDICNYQNNDSKNGFVTLILGDFSEVKMVDSGQILKPGVTI